MLSKGYRVGQYVLLNQVGSGGFGDVWKAEKRTALDTNYFALKFFRPKDDRIDFDTIGKELAVWKRLKGLPHIISVIELDSFQDYVYVVSDFADGGSLEKWLKNNHGKATSQAEAVKITLEILTGLENLHEKGFVHRDLKPDNILIMNGKFCLTDFGVSREIKTHSKATGTAGTMEYMPPEAFAKSPSITSQTDIWAVGVILQKLLTGELPFPQEDYPALIGAITMFDPEPMPESIPEGLREIVKKTLQKKREDRFRSAAEMMEALKNPDRFLTEQHNYGDKTEILIKSDLKDSEKIDIAVTKDWREIEAELRRRDEKVKQVKPDEAELERKKAENKAKIERLTESYRQHIVNHQRFSSHEIAELKRLIGPKAFETLTDKFSREVPEKKGYDADAEANEQKNKAANFVSKSGNEDSAEPSTTPKKRNLFGAVIVSIGGILLIFFIIASVMKSNNSTIGNSNTSNTASCSKFTRDSSGINLQPCTVNGKHGFSNPDGKLIIGAIFADVYPFESNSGLAAVKSGSKYKWGFIDAKGDVKIDFQYDAVESFSAGFAVVTLAGEKFLIDTTGKRVKETSNNSNSASNTISTTSEPALTSSTCATGTFNTGATLRSTPYFPNDDNILSVWDKDGEVEILGITDGQARSTTGNTKWCKVKVTSGNCDSSKQYDCEENKEGYVNADLISCS